MKLALMIVVAILQCAHQQVKASDTVYLEDRDRSSRKSEALWLYIATDGRMVTDSGHTATFESLAELFTEWRSQGSEPGITLILYPSLKSNSDLKKVHGIINFLRANHVFCGITIEGADTPAEKMLL